jgi:restriction system protein
MLPLLKYTGDQREHSIHDAVEVISNDFRLTDEERHQLLKSGHQAIIDNRVGWARTYMARAGLLETTRRSYFRITAEGLKVLKQNPEKINVKFLLQYPSFAAFHAYTRKEKTQETEAEENPREQLEEGYQTIRSSLAQELIQQVKKSTPQFFENLVVDLMVAMGYGGSRKDAGEAIGKSGDEGIDGIIREDKLGLDTIYIQAKSVFGKST